jgi:predicted porin
MRKILLGTTAVAGAALLAPAAFAQAPAPGVTSGAGSLRGNNEVGTQGVQAPAPAIAAASGLRVRLGGYFDFSGAMIYDDWDQARSRINGGSSNGGAPNAVRRSRYDFRNDLELYVDVNGRATNGMTYGAHFEFQMDNGTGTAGDNSNVSMDEAYGFISFPNVGTFRFGAEDSAPSLLQVRAPSAGLVGTDGDWQDFIWNGGLYSSPYLTSGFNDGNDATKVIYLSPQFAGFDFGVSYAVNNGEGERTDFSNGQAQRNQAQGTLNNEIGVGVRYRGTFGPVGVNAGLGAMWADAGTAQNSGAPLTTTSAGAAGLQQQNVNAYTAGLTFSAYGFAVGGEYTFGSYNGSSVGRTPLMPGLEDSWHYIIGATYTMGPLLFGANFAQAEQDNGSFQTRQSNGVVTSNVDLPNRKHTIWGVGVVYTLAPGLALYGIYQNLNDDNVPTGAPVNANYIRTGTSVGTQLASFSGSSTRTVNVGMLGIRLAF